MEQFSLEKYLENPSRKVVTRDGRAVRILCTDAKAKDGCCIIAAIETDGEEEGYQFFKDGKAYSSKSSIEDCADLFFADEEEESQSIEIPFGAKDSEFIRDEYYIPDGCEARIEGNKVIIEKIQKGEELTEFDYAVLSIISDHNSHTDSIEDFAKRSSKKLLDLARKELQPEFDEDKIKQEIERWIKEKHFIFTEIDEIIETAHHFAEWGRNHFEDKSEMVSEETTIVNDWQYGKDPDHAIIPAIRQRRNLQ